MPRIVNISRRRFLLGAAAGAGGLVLGMRLPSPASATTPTSPAGSATFRPGVFLSIREDGQVTIVAHRSDMGTGVRTCLPMVVAEELGADWSRVTIEQAIGHDKYGSQDTDGSRSTREFYPVMRTAGATARAMLEAAAAARLGVEPASCEARNHQVVHAASGRAIPFGQLVASAASLPVPDPGGLRFRSAHELRYVGKHVPMVDQTDIVHGRAIFGMDVKVDGLKYAVIARPPVAGSSVAGFDATECLAVPGVEQVLPLRTPWRPYGFAPVGGIAVVASGTWEALQGRRKLKVEFTRSDESDHDSASHDAHLAATVREPGSVVRHHGSVDTALASAARTHEAVYSMPHLAHASMEPPVATAHVTDRGCEIWAPTQNPQRARDAVASALGMQKRYVTVHVTLLGGGFGRKSKPDYIVEAALLSREVNAPVRVVWSREDDLRHDYYHTVSAMYLKAGLDARGRPQAWLQRVAFPPIRSTFLPGFLPWAKTPSAGELAMGFTDVPFDVPHLACETRTAHAHTRIGWFRGVANLYHAFALGSFAAELAHVAGVDPLEYLLELIGKDRHVDLDGASYDNMGASLAVHPVDTGRLRRVTEAAARSAGWGRKLPRGRGMGIASHRSFLSYVATVVEVEVSRDGTLRIPRVHVAIDCGHVIHPDRVRAQMEGAAVFGASLARTGEITFENGAVRQSNFHDYPVERMHEAPRDIQVTLIASDEPPSGVGEPGVPPFAPALTNAIFAATGHRIRQLPLARHKLAWS